MKTNSYPLRLKRTHNSQNLLPLLLRSDVYASPRYIGCPFSSKSITKNADYSATLWVQRHSQLLFLSSQCNSIIFFIKFIWALLTILCRPCCCDSVMKIISNWYEKRQFWISRTIFHLRSFYQSLSLHIIVHWYVRIKFELESIIPNPVTYSGQRFWHEKIFNHYCRCVDNLQKLQNWRVWPRSAL